MISKLCGYYLSVVTTITCAAVFLLLQRAFTILPPRMTLTTLSPPTSSPFSPTATLPFRMRQLSVPGYETTCFALFTEEEKEKAWRVLCSLTWRSFLDEFINTSFASYYHSIVSETYANARQEERRKNITTNDNERRGDIRPCAFHSETEPFDLRHFPYLPENDTIEGYLTGELLDALQYVGLTFFAGAGTALGAYRHGGMIPFDYDSDFIVPVDLNSPLFSSEWMHRSQMRRVQAFTLWFQQLFAIHPLFRQFPTAFLIKEVGLASPWGLAIDISYGRGCYHWDFEINPSTDWRTVYHGLCRSPFSPSKNGVLMLTDSAGYLRNLYSKEFMTPKSRGPWPNPPNPEYSDTTDIAIHPQPQKNEEEKEKENKEKRRRQAEEANEEWRRFA